MRQVAEQPSLAVVATRDAKLGETRAIVVNSPSNPTGAVVEPGELVKIARLAKKHGFWLLYDDRNVYVAARCWSTAPDRIVATAPTETASWPWHRCVVPSMSRML